MHPSIKKISIYVQVDLTIDLYSISLFKKLYVALRYALYGPTRVIIVQSAYSSLEDLIAPLRYG